jgi:hypothetical protein
MKVRCVVCVAFVILFVLVSSGLCATTVISSLCPASVDASKLLNSRRKVKDFLTLIPSVIENLISANLVDVLPHPGQSIVFLIKEVFYVMQTLRRRLPDLLCNPGRLIISALPYVAALMLIVMSLMPGFILPSKVIAFLLSILRLFNDYWAPFDKIYLSQL